MRPDCRHLGERGENARYMNTPSPTGYGVLFLLKKTLSFSRSLTAPSRATSAPLRLPSLHTNDTKDTSDVLPFASNVLTQDRLDCTQHQKGVYDNPQYLYT